MEMDELKSPECPTIDDLSAWFDKELESETVEQHVAECPACKKCLNEFQSIDSSISELIKVEKNLITRIGQNCIHEISQPRARPEVKPFLNWTKIAAGFVIAGVIFFMSQSTEVVDKNMNEFAGMDDIPITGKSDIQLDQSTSSQNNRYQEPIRATNVSHIENSRSSAQRVVNPGSRGPIGVVAVDSDISATSLAFSRHNSKLTENSHVDMMLVGYEINDVYTPTTHIADGSGKQIPGSGQINHTWVMDDPVSPLIFLKTLLVRQQGVFDQLIDQDLDRYHLKLKIRDKNFKNLVSYLEKMNCELSIPQATAKSEDRKLPDEIFQYNVDFVKR